MYSNDFIYDSATISGVAGVDLGAIPHRAVGFGTDGRLRLATNSAAAVGVTLSTCGTISEGASVTVLVKDIGLLQVLESVETGDFVGISEDGFGCVAQSGKAVFGRAFSSGSAGDLVQVQILSCGQVLA